MEIPEGTAGIIDVPGHEKFIKNMLAGAGALDIVLMVVAADEGVMPQTKEHSAILELHGTLRGLVVLTKCDMVDEEMMELAAGDVREAFAGTFLEIRASLSGFLQNGSRNPCSAGGNLRSVKDNTGT
jgi:selenocysteine-specific elongation factor